MSQICALIFLPSVVIDLVANSTPIVDLDSRLNSFRVNRESRFDLPTPESPMRTTADKDAQHNCKKRPGTHREEGDGDVCCRRKIIVILTFEQIIVVSVLFGGHGCGEGARS